MHKLSPNVSLLKHSSIQVTYKKTVLPNGIRIVTEEIPYVRSISIGVWIDVGSRDENEQNNGISHFLEHMVFKGTKRYTSKQIAQSLESVGGYLNAFTTKEHTCYYARILDDQLLKAVDVISELVQYPVFDKKEIEKEKQVVLEELKNIEDDPDDLIHDYFDAHIYRKHPLGYPVIGRAENIMNFSLEKLSDYATRHYIPKRIVVATTGNCKHENIVELVERYFRNNHHHGSLKRATVSHRYGQTTEVYEKPIMQAHVCMGTRSFSIKSRMRYPLLVLNTLLGEGMSSRLFQNIREKYGFAYSVYSFANLLSDTGNFGVYIGTDVANIENSIELIQKELDILKSKPVGHAEVKRTKAQVKGAMMLSLESMSNRMMRLGGSELYFGRYVPVDEILQNIDTVDEKALYETANKLFQVENFSTVIFKPTKPLSSKTTSSI
ncbi:MAG: insulinase family protein [Ignavibacteriae bacterium]|nr:insulinase family protein [Ignavibacteriota bacterium]